MVMSGILTEKVLMMTEEVTDVRPDFGYLIINKKLLLLALPVPTCHRFAKPHLPAEAEVMDFYSFTNCTLA